MSKKKAKTEQEQGLDCLDEKSQSVEDIERRKKIKDFLWCSDKFDSVIPGFSEISHAIKTAKNKALTQSYFHPIDPSYTYYSESDFTKEALAANKRMMEEYMEQSKSVTPPKWFKPIPPKKIELFLQLFNVIEVPQIISSIRRVYTIVDKLQIDITPNDIDDIRYIYKLKHSFQSIDFNEFLYSLASIDLLKKTFNKELEDSDHRLSETQELLFSVLVIFTVAAASVCLNREIEGVPKEVESFFKCKINCEDQLSSCLYNKMEEQFRRLDNYKCSPYFLSLLSYKKLIPDCNDNKRSSECQDTTLVNPIAQHVRNTRYNKKGKVVVDDVIMKEILSVYRKNGCLLATFPDVHNVPMFREVLGHVTVFEPICSSPNRISEIVYVFKKYKTAALAYRFKPNEPKSTFRELEKYALKSGKLYIPKVNACLLNDFQYHNLTPALYTKAFNHMRNMKEKQKEMYKTEMASKNAKSRFEFLKKKFSPSMVNTMVQVFDTYNTSDPQLIFLNRVEQKLNLSTNKKPKDPDVF